MGSTKWTGLIECAIFIRPHFIPNYSKKHFIPNCHEGRSHNKEAHNLARSVVLDVFGRQVAFTCAEKSIQRQY
jgi:hypothetical protein